MQDNNGNYIFFSSLGKRSNKYFLIKNYFIPRKERYYSIKDRINNNFIVYDEEKDLFIEKDIFDISYQNNKADSNINNSYSLINRYKNNKIHLEKLKKFKEEKLFKKEKNYCDQIYEPNIDFIKKRIIIGPKWETLSGRKEYQIINNSNVKPNDTSLNIQKIESFDEEKNNFNLTKKTSREEKNINSPNTKLLNTSKSLLNKKEIKNVFKSSFFKINKRKLFSSKKEKKTSQKNKSMLNLNTKLFIPKLYILDNIKFANTKIGKYISPPSKPIEPKKKINLKNEIKIFKNKNIGLNPEELKFINEIKNHKKLKLLNYKSKSKVIKIEKKHNTIKKVKSPENEKNKIMINNYYDLKDNFLQKKSYNYYIIKSILKSKDNNKYEYMNKKNSNSFSHKLNIFNEFYDFDCDKISIYNFNKFDNVTYKTISNKKYINNK